MNRPGSLATESVAPTSFCVPWGLRLRLNRDDEQSVDSLLGRLKQGFTSGLGQAHSSTALEGIHSDSPPDERSSWIRRDLAAAEVRCSSRHQILELDAKYLSHSEQGTYRRVCGNAHP